MLHRTGLFAIAAVAAAALGLGCKAVGVDPKDEQVAARIGDEVITVAELDETIKEDLFKRETGDGNPAKVHELRAHAVKALVARRVIEGAAKKQGTTTEAYLEGEFAKLPAVTDADVKAFYDQNVAQMRGTPLETVAPRIKSHLENEARRKAVETIVARADAKIELVRPRVELRPGGPSRGPETAPVTIVEFSDFQCPFCQRAEPVLKEIAARYPNDVRIVYRHLPLDPLHPRARASAEAAACAADGNKFWEFHDQVFANTRALADEDLRKYAAAVGLDAATFDECVRTRKHAATVEEDAQEAKRIGITGTPAFVVNGIVMFGFQTADALDAMIQEELGAKSEPATASAEPKPTDS
jgi:predicted DsbA family dithiol-disulfide isomerase